MLICDSGVASLVLRFSSTCLFCPAADEFALLPIVLVPAIGFLLLAPLNLVPVHQ